ncbi:hypothetical protein KP509_23G000900 [Ceratopteris richardii]|nr:hypothetical protein KP509_23G000900 [Ceratopteris richardii]
MGIAYSSKQQNTSLKPAYAEREEPLQIDQWGSEGDRKPKLDRKCNEEDRCDYAQSGKFMCDSRNAQLRLHSSIKKAANVNGNTDAVACQGELATAEPAPLLRHVDAEAGHGHSVDTTVRPRFRSKWEDAERWLRPAASEQRLQQEGCTPSLPNFGLLKMSDCMNRGAVIHPYFPVHHRSTSSIHSSSASANPHDKIGSSNVAVHGERATGKHPASSRMQSIQIGCFDSPYTAICATDSAFRKQLPSVEQAACIRGGALVRPRFSYPQRNCGDMRKSTMYCLSNRHHEDSGRMEDRSIDYSSSKEVNPLVGERNMLPPDSLSTTMEANTTAHSAGISKTAALFASSQMHLSHVARMDSDKMIIPLISMRDMGTQISSGDCSGSISRYTSENASPRRHSGMLLPSPAGHNTPAGMASLSGSASNSRHLKAGAGSDRGGSGGAKHLSTAPCIALELQVRLHSAERHLRSSSSPVSLSSSSSSSSSSPTLSNHRRCQEDSTQSSEPITQRHRHSLSDWSSRKTVQIELGRGFEQRNPELKTGSNDRHVRFCSPWNIDGQDSSKLPKTGCNKLRSQRMGDTIDEEDDHKLKQSERSQSTMRMNDILHNTREKAEKMRTRTYVTKTGSTKFRHLRARSLSLSPVSRCTCFSILQ